MEDSCAFLTRCSFRRILGGQLEVNALPDARRDLPSCLSGRGDLSYPGDRRLVLGPNAGESITLIVSSGGNTRVEMDLLVVCPGSAIVSHDPTFLRGDVGGSPPFLKVIVYSSGSGAEE